MELSEYAAYDGVGLKQLLDKREVTADELRDAATRAIEQVNPAVNGLVFDLFDQPLPHSPSGPLAGVPFLVKDLVCTPAGQPNELGSRMFASHVAPEDTTLMRRFQDAGLVTLGKTATPEFGFNANTAPVVNGPTRNPWNPDRIPGGSSGGSGALVAARAVPIAHANDGGGSIRIPASCNGLVGLKPTRGRVPLGPQIDEALNGLAIEFVLTRTVRDAAAVLDAVHGPSVGDKYVIAPPARPYADEIAVDGARLRVALHTESFWGIPTHPEVRAAVEAVARELESQGHHVEPAVPVIDAEALLASQVTIWTWFLALTAVGLGALFGRTPTPDNVEAATWACVEHGLKVTGIDLGTAFATQNAVTRACGAFLNDYDLLLTPTLPVPPLPVGSLNQNDPKYATAESWCNEVFGYAAFTPLFNVSGQPSVSLPLGISSEQLPIGVMLNAQACREDLLLQVASELEQAMPWTDRQPPVCAG